MYMCAGPADQKVSGNRIVDTAPYSAAGVFQSYSPGSCHSPVGIDTASQGQAAGGLHAYVVLLYMMPASETRRGYFLVIAIRCSSRQPSACLSSRFYESFRHVSAVM